MILETLAESVREEFFSIYNLIDPNTPLRDLLRQEISESAGLMQKSDHAGMSDDGNVAQDEEARHAAEIVAEKRKLAQDGLREQLSAEAERENKLRCIAVSLMESAADWLNIEDG